MSVTCVNSIAFIVCSAALARLATLRRLACRSQDLVANGLDFTLYQWAWYTADTGVRVGPQVSERVGNAVFLQWAAIPLPFWLKLVLASRPVLMITAALISWVIDRRWLLEDWDTRGTRELYSFIEEHFGATRVEFDRTIAAHARSPSRARRGGA